RASAALHSAMRMHIKYKEYFADMGICKLTELLKEKAPKSVRNTQAEKCRGWRVAIDASMILYQSLVAIRHGIDSLTNKEGETTAHIYGIFYKTINILEKGIIPVYIFDGQAPELKENTLQERRDRKEKAEKDLEAAETEEDREKYVKRAVRATKYHVESAQALLKAMGVPYETAPNEAEGYCAALNAAGYVDAVVSEDMDSLAFGGKMLLRNLLPSIMKKNVPVMEICLETALKQTELEHTEFVDLCILLGCDYCKRPKGVGPKKAYELIQKHRTIEKIVECESLQIDADSWPYKEARNIFLLQRVDRPKAFAIDAPDTEELFRFLVDANGFDRGKVQSGVNRLNAVKKAKKQSSLLSFAKKVI
ncbi:flap endonuclease-1, partial [Nematocida major]|uniref:flap endonuclease-1 n=1 Tax=Nematocida major TaxID=1912982 RepID=UPI00200834D2